MSNVNPIGSFDTDLKIHQALGDEPNIDNGLSADEMKAKFDQAGLLIQKFINEVLIPAVNNLIGDIGATEENLKDYLPKSGGHMSGDLYTDGFRVVLDSSGRIYISVGSDSAEMMFGAGGEDVMTVSPQAIRAMKDLRLIDRLYFDQEGEAGAYIESIGKPAEDGGYSHPALAFYGSKGDEKVRLSNIGEAEEGEDAVSLQFLQNWIKENAVPSINAKKGALQLPLSGTATCSAPPDANVKTVEPNIAEFAPVDGAHLTVDFQTQNLADNPVLAYGGYFAGPIVGRNGQRIGASDIGVRVHHFVRMGPNWVLLDPVEPDVDVGVKTINGKSPDENGNSVIDTGVMTINSLKPDQNGNVKIPDGVSSVNGQTGEVRLPIPGFGTCESAAAEQIKAVYTEGDCDFIAAGSVLRVKFDHANAAENPMLSIDETAATPIFDHRTGVPAEADAITAGIHTFVWFGGRWWLIDPAVESANLDAAQIADAVKESFPGGIGYPVQRTIALTYSGNPDDYETIKTTSNGIDIYLALIDSSVYSPEDLIGGSLTVVINGRGESFTPITEDDINTIGDVTSVLDVCVLVAAPGASAYGLTFDKAGVYAVYRFVADSTESVVTELLLANTISAPKKIAAEYLPGATLPPVTSADDGKNLTVVDGKWAAAPGASGVSPTVAVTDIDGGHRVTITDAEGPKTFDVPDGDTGPAGPAGKDGGYYTPSVDSEGNLTWRPSETNMGPVPAQKIIGPAGADGTSFVWRGEWDESTMYRPNDVVSYDGSAWIMKLDGSTVGSVGAVPGVDMDWELLAKSGADGADGKDSAGMAYVATCNTSANNPVKAVGVTDDRFAARDGVCLHIIFTNGNTAGGLQLSVNGTAAPIKNCETLLAAGTDDIGVRMHTFAYCNSAWWLLDPVAASGSGVTVDDTLSQSGQAADAAATGSALAGKLDTPSGVGQAGQVPVLQTDGTTAWGSVSGESGGSSASVIPVYTCASAGSEQAKACVSDTETIPYTNGYLFAVTFSNVNTADAPVLISGSHNYPVVLADMTSASASHITAGTHVFVLVGRFALLLNPHTGS